MIIQGKGNSIKHAPVIQVAVASTVTRLDAGQPVTLDASGKLILATGATKPLVCASDMNPTTDNVKDHGGMASVFASNLIITIDATAFDSGQTYAYGTKLKAAAGKWTPVAAAAEENLAGAMALGAASNGQLRIMTV